MKKLNQWCHAHPYKALFFSNYFTGTASLMAVVNEQGFYYGLTCFIVGLIFFMAVLSSDMRKLPIALAFVLATGSLDAAEPPQPSPVGIGVGVVVVCVGGYCVYKVAKFCQKKFPKTPATNTVENFNGSGDEETAASWNYGAMGTCDPTLTPGPDDFRFADTSVGTLFAIDLAVNESGGVAMQTSAQVGDAVTQNWTDFQTEVAQYGVMVTGANDGSQYFSHNRIPCTADETPIRFDDATKTVVFIGDGPMKLIEVERSRDLVNWSPFLRTRVSAGGPRLRIEDATTASSIFYRVAVSDVP